VLEIRKGMLRSASEYYIRQGQQGKEKYFTGVKCNPVFYPFLFRVMVTWKGKPEDQPVLFWMGG